MSVEHDYDLCQSIRDEQTALRSVSNSDKDDEIKKMGFLVEEHPTAEPCRVCGYDRRYAAFPNHCLYCEAFN